MNNRSFGRFVRTTLVIAAVLAAVGVAHASLYFQEGSKGVFSSALSKVVTFVDEPMSTVPETETSAMVLLGLGLIGTIVRRRKFK